MVATLSENWLLGGTLGKLKLPQKLWKACRSTTPDLHCSIISLIVCSTHWKGKRENVDVSSFHPFPPSLTHNPFVMSYIRPLICAPRRRRWNEQLTTWCSNMCPLGQPSRFGLKKKGKFRRPNRQHFLINWTQNPCYICETWKCNDWDLIMIIKIFHLMYPKIMFL